MDCRRRARSRSARRSPRSRRRGGHRLNADTPTRTALGPEPWLPGRSRGLTGALAERYLRGFFARHFGGLHVALDRPAPTLTGPTVFYVNHPSWWDPVVLLLLIRRCYPDWQFFGPIDDRALARYPWFERLGLFGIEPGSVAGTRRFLRIGTALLSRPRTGIAITAQGEFADVRSRPVVLKRGLAGLLEQNPAATAIPVALEYAFWNERLPEVLVGFGREGIRAAGRSRDALQARLASALESELDTLAALSMTRDPSRFDRLVEGRRGVGWLQDLPLRLRERLRGRQFDPAHSALGRQSRS